MARIGLKYERQMIELYKRQLGEVKESRVEAELQKILGDEHRHERIMQDMIVQFTGKQEAAPKSETGQSLLDLRKLLHEDLVLERDVENHYLKFAKMDELDEATRKSLERIIADTKAHVNAFKWLEEYAKKKK